MTTIEHKNSLNSRKNQPVKSIDLFKFMILITPCHHEKVQPGEAQFLVLKLHLRDATHHGPQLLIIWRAVPAVLAVDQQQQPSHPMWSLVTMYLSLTLWKPVGN